MKTLIKIILVLAVLAAAGIYFFGGSALNKAVKHGIETIAPELLGVPVTVESVDISVTSGSGTLKGLLVGTPEGFKAEKSCSFGEITVDIEPKSIMSDVVHIEAVKILAPEFVYEKQGLMGESNIDALMANLEKPSTDDSGASAGEKGEASEEKKIRIDSFVIEDGKAQLMMLGQSADISLPAINIENIGGEEGVTPEEAAKQIFKKVFKNVVGNAAGAVKDVFKGGGELIKGGVEAGVETGKKAAEGVKDGVKDGVKGIKDGVKGVKGLFGK